MIDLDVIDDNLYDGDKDETVTVRLTAPAR